jgi:DNA-binding CsgD family transcriptional regulator/PAS domain-containing protein
MDGGSYRSHSAGIDLKAVILELPRARRPLRSILRREAPKDAQDLIQMGEIPLACMEIDSEEAAHADTSQRIRGRAMVTVEDFSRLVSGIYAAAVTPQHWQLAIHDIHRMLDATGGGMLIVDENARSVLSTSVPPDARKSYGEYYRHIDYVLAAVETGPVGLIRSGSELVALKAGSEFDADWMRPYLMDDGLFVRLTNGATPTCFLVAAPKRSESFDTPDRVKLMSGLVPHLQQALRTQDKLAALADSAVELAGVLEVVRHGVIIVAGEHLVINLNSAAERIVRAEDGLYMRAGRMAATSTRAEQELHCAIRNALEGEPSTVRTGRSLTCFRPSGKRPYVIHVLPSHRRNADEPLRQPMALVLVIDPDDEPEPAVSLLRRLYGLTKTEAEVALRVMRGTDLKQIAEELSISYGTVRTHLQHVFDKTDTHRQAELVRLLLVLTP